MPITMKDIAKKLNVSVVTVSNALHNRHNVSEKTRKLILKTAKELNYIPDDIARSLAGKDTKTIGVLIPDISDSFFVEILNSIENIASKNNRITSSFAAPRRKALKLDITPTIVKR